MGQGFGLTEYLHFLQRPESHGNKVAVTEFRAVCFNRKAAKPAQR